MAKYAFDNKFRCRLYWFKSIQDMIGQDYFSESFSNNKKLM